MTKRRTSPPIPDSVRHAGPQATPPFLETLGKQSPSSAVSRDVVERRSRIARTGSRDDRYTPWQWTVRLISTEAAAIISVNSMTRLRISRAALSRRVVGSLDESSLLGMPCRYLADSPASRSSFANWSDRSPTGWFCRSLSLSRLDGMHLQPLHFDSCGTSGPSPHTRRLTAMHRVIQPGLRAEAAAPTHAAPRMARGGAVEVPHVNDA